MNHMITSHELMSATCMCKMIMEFVTTSVGLAPTPLFFCVWPWNYMHISLLKNLVLVDIPNVHILQWSLPYKHLPMVATSLTWSLDAVPIEPPLVQYLRILPNSDTSLFHKWTGFSLPLVPGLYKIHLIMHTLACLSCKIVHCH